MMNRAMLWGIGPRDPAVWAKAAVVTRSSNVSGLTQQGYFSLRSVSDVSWATLLLLSLNSSSVIQAVSLSAAQMGNSVRKWHPHMYWILFWGDTSLLLLVRTKQCSLNSEEKKFWVCTGHKILPTVSRRLSLFHIHLQILLHEGLPLSASLSLISLQNIPLVPVVGNFQFYMLASLLILYLT